MSRKSNTPGKRTTRRARPPRAAEVGPASAPAQPGTGATAPGGDPAVQPAGPASAEPPSLAGRGRGRVETPAHQRPSALLDTRVIYCGDCLDQLQKLPDACIDLIYIDPPFNSNRTCEVFWGDRSEPRAQASGFLEPFEDRHASTQAYIDFMRPRCVEPTRVLKKKGSRPKADVNRADVLPGVLLERIKRERLQPAPTQESLGQRRCSAQATLSRRSK